MTRFHTLAALSLMLSLIGGCNSADVATDTGVCATAAATGSTATLARGASSAASRQAVVDAANAFLATLSTSQRASVQLSLTQTLASRWSNLPCGSGCRNGIQYSTLTATQLAAAQAVEAAATSATGYNTFEAIRKADTFLGQTRSGYNEGIYFMAFLGTPSTSSRWILQFGGHHYAINLNYTGTDGTTTATPMFVGVEPQSFTLNGVAYQPLETRRAAMVNMMSSLTTAQLATARLSQSFNDVLLGPGQDNAFPATPSGIAYGALSASSQALVRTAIETWVNDMEPTEAAVILAAYESDAALAQTYVSYSNSINLTVQGSYIRIDGPRVWIEMVAQNGVVLSGIHFHTIWRDQTQDYGGSLSGTSTDEDPC